MKTFSFSEWLSSGGSNTLSAYVTSIGAYGGNNWVYAAVNRIATTASSAPLIFFQGDENSLPTFDPKQQITDKNHPVLKLFNPPRYPLIPSLRELLYRTLLHLGIDGKIFWIFERKGRIPVAIDLRGKDELQPLYKDASTKRDVVGWFETATNKPYKLEDVLLLQEYKPDISGGASLDGLSPLKPARASLESDFQINGWNSSFFKTGMKTPLLIQTKGRLTADQKTEIKKEVINYYSGIDGAHGAMVLQGGVDVSPLQVGTKDIDFIQGKKLTREELLAVYGVPPSLVGLFEYASYANAREQTQIFWEQTLVPKLSALLELIQINILDVSFPGVYAKWDLSKVAGLRPDPVALAAPAKIYSDMGYHPSQIAKIFGFPALEPDKTFDKLRQDRQRQQLAYQQELTNINQANNSNDTNSNQSGTVDKPKKEFLLTQLELKLVWFANEVANNSSIEFRNELWDVLVHCFLDSYLSNLKNLTVSKQAILDIVDRFKTVDPTDLLLTAKEIAKVLVDGIYNSH